MDVSARADVLDATRNSLKKLMSKANGIRDIIEIQRELNRLTEAYEQSRRRATTLHKESVSRFAADISEIRRNLAVPEPWLFVH